MYLHFPLLGKISATLLLIILSAIALLHFYWAIGGKWGMEKAVPSKENGELLFVPTKLSCFVVGLGLMILVYLVYGFSFASYINDSHTKPLEWLAEFKLLSWFLKNSLLIFGSIFLIRAIGDFRHVGFFKKVKQTEFARLDTQYYSPLCLLMSCLFFLLYFNLPSFNFYF